MIRFRRRASVLTVACALAVVPALSACGAGESPETTKPTRLTEGINLQIPADPKKPAQVGIRNLFILGAPHGLRLPVNSDAPVYADLIGGSGSPDRLTSVTSPAFAGGSEIAGGGINLPPGRRVPFNAQPPGPRARPSVILKGLTRPLFGGDNVRLTLTFAGAGSVEVLVPVIPQSGDFGTYPAVPANPSPSPSGTATAAVKATRPTGTGESATPTP